MKAELPHNESARLSALDDLDILDTASEEVFDRLTRLAAIILQVPIVLISFVTEDRQWFKSKVGLDPDETHRDLAFCSHAILDDDILVVPDAHSDPRFSNNPLVTGDPEIRFYAGAPLVLSDGIRLGTLCAIDSKPRELGADQAQALTDLAAIVVDELNLRKSLEVQAEIRRDLQEQATELGHANQALDQYAYMASHDLRAPLKKIMNLADLAVLDSAGQAQSLVGPIRDSAAKLEQIVLGYGRLAGLQKQTTSDELVSSMISQALSSGEPGLRVEVGGDVTVACDPDLVTQAFVNLFDNARKYGRGGDLAVEILDSHGNATINVSNAVAEEFSVDQSVFAPFRRLVSDSDGSGLGLAIVQRVMQLHGGSASASCSDHRFIVQLCIPKSSHR